jgi:hypothetical protein
MKLRALASLYLLGVLLQGCGTIVGNGDENPFKEENGRDKRSPSNDAAGDGVINEDAENDVASISDSSFYSDILFNNCYSPLKDSVEANFIMNFAGADLSERFTFATSGAVKSIVNESELISYTYRISSSADGGVELQTSTTNTFATYTCGSEQTVSNYVLSGYAGTVTKNSIELTSNDTVTTLIWYLDLGDGIGGANKLVRIEVMQNDSVLGTYDLD